jgi:hypothetical protein
MRRLVALMVVMAAMLALTVVPALAGPDRSENSCGSQAHFYSNGNVGYCPGIDKAQRP